MSYEEFSPNITTHIFQLPKFIENTKEMTDDDVWDAINDRILAQQLENPKMERAHELEKRKAIFSSV